MNLSALAIQKALANQWQEAISINNDILSEDSENIDALNRLAQAYIHIGECDKAKVCYFQVLKIDKYNPIARRNLDKLKNLSNGQAVQVPKSVINQCSFIEEPGKTKIVLLTRLGEKGILSQLKPSIPLDFTIRCQAICLYYERKYIGKLPDDIGKKLIWLLSRHNHYQFHIRAIQEKRISVFIKEIRRSPENMDYASF